MLRIPPSPNGVLLSALLVVASSACAGGQAVVAARPATDGIDVLFVGNSYTYYNNLPRLVEAISESVAGPVIRANQHTHGGFSIRRHLDDGHIPGILDTPASDGFGWERVVLQEHSRLGVAYADSVTGTLGNADPFHDAARTLVGLVRERAGEPLFYMTWAKEQFPDQSAGLALAYEQIGSELSVGVAPVGLAWARVRQERPDLKLFIEDGSHPTPLGSYLAAAVLYGQLTGYSPVGAQARVSGVPWKTPGVAASDTPALLVDLEEDLANYLQQVAWEVVESYSAN